MGFHSPSGFSPPRRMRRGLHASRWRRQRSASTAAGCARSRPGQRWRRSMRSGAAIRSSIPRARLRSARPQALAAGRAPVGAEVREPRPRVAGQLLLDAGLGQPRVRREQLPQAAPRALNQAEQRQLLRAVERTGARDRALVAVMLFTALRIGEAVALDLEDLLISARKGEVVVRSGKGDAGRSVPLNAVVRDMLRECLAERRAPDDERALYVTRRGSRLCARRCPPHARYMCAPPQARRAAAARCRGW